MVTKTDDFQTRKKVNQGLGDKLFISGVYTYLWITLIIVLYPLIYVISSSFSSPEAVIAGRVWLFPVDFSIEGYLRVFQNESVGTGFFNSIVNTALGTLINVFITMLAAYPASRSNFKHANLFMRLIVFTMLFSGGIVPLYIIVKDLHLLNTRWALMLPNAMAAYFVIVCRTFFKSTIPEAIYESAYIDGCSEFRILKDMVIPLSKPIIAVLALMYAINHWNSYFNALIYINNSDLYPLQIILRNILIANNVDIGTIADAKTMMEMEGMRDLLKYSLIVVASAPVLAIYPFAQKFFIKGMMLGSVKG